MSRLNRLKQRAQRRKVYAHPSHYYPGYWDVYVDAEGAFGLRGLKYSKRMAIHLAYQISIAKKHKLVVTSVDL